MYHWFLFFSPFVTVLSPAELPGKPNLTVEIQNIQHNNGRVFVALFKSGNGFPSGKPMEGKELTPNGRNAHATFSLEPGEYAVAVFHDENGNGKLDKRLMGIPKEPYGFSNNFRPKFSAPKFSDCLIKVGEGEKKISIELKNF